MRMLYNANQRVPYIAVIQTNTSTRKEMRLLMSTAESAQIALRQDKRKKKKSVFRLSVGRVHLLYRLTVTKSER